MQTLALTLWIVSVAVFAVLMMYRAHLTNLETDELFLSNNIDHSNRKQEHDDVVRRVARLRPFCQGAGGAAALTTVIVAGLAIASVVHAAAL
ncbi:MAG: hypothetical protein PW735_04435 [Acidobacteriaceae bacterium]|nr:hypothetical protein [Acidobacteriaceae bacterium]